MPHDSLWDDELESEMRKIGLGSRPKIYERNPDNGKVRWRYINDYGHEKMMQDTYNFDNHIHMKILEQEVDIIKSRLKYADTGAHVSASKLDAHWRLRTAVSVLEERIEELKNGL